MALGAEQQITKQPWQAILIMVGVALWGVGIFFETVGDLQLAAFVADPTKKGQVLDYGLWRYTRHPNYFGDFAVWWGMFLVAATGTPARWFILGPIVMSVLLLKVSGVALLEKGIERRRPSYQRYIETTSAFFPRPPLRPTTPTEEG